MTTDLEDCLAFFLLDGRAKIGDVDGASVLGVAFTEDEAREEGSTIWRDMDAIWYENGVGLRWDIPPANKQ